MKLESFDVNICKFTHNVLEMSHKNITQTDRCISKITALSIKHRTKHEEQNAETVTFLHGPTLGTAD